MKKVMCLFAVSILIMGSCNVALASPVTGKAKVPKIETVTSVNSDTLVAGQSVISDCVLEATQSIYMIENINSVKTDAVNLNTETITGYGNILGNRFRWFSFIQTNKLKIKPDKYFCSKCILLINYKKTFDTLNPDNPLNC